MNMNIVTGAMDEGKKQTGEDDNPSLLPLVPRRVIMNLDIELWGVLYEVE
jgi:hypothetical protein